MPYEYLDRIDSPADLRALPVTALPKVAEELRDFLVTSVSKTGGHLGASLGAVDFTLALHYVYDTPRDRVVWDVGHQAYGHKVLTGRRGRFHTLRQYKGVCGFPKRSESEYDAFAAGHAGTALSAAFGMAVARDLLRQDHRVLAVVGDASVSNGLSFEAMNSIAHRQDTDLTVILNDNEMSISPNVGAMSAYLNKILAGKPFNDARTRLERLLDRIPNVGPQVLKMAHHAEEALKGFVTPGTLFEELGFRYYGPLNGHDVLLLVEIFRRVRELKGPILLHVVTQKGRGYEPAEKDPEKFHGVAVFDKETGEILPGSTPPAPTYTKVFGETLVAMGERFPKLYAITAAMADGTGLKAFSERFPERFIDVGIAESHAVCMAAGLACEGLKPVVAIYSTFLQRAYDQVIHDVCMQNLPVVFVLDRGGIVGEDGETHQGVFDLSFLRCVPNLVVMAPTNADEMRHMLLTALEHEGPVVLRYPRSPVEGVPFMGEIRSLPLGKGVVTREGPDYGLLAVGRMVPVAEKAWEILKDEGCTGTVANMRFVKPVDRELLRALAGRVPALWSLEENAVIGGFGTACLEALREEGLSGKLRGCLGVPDRFLEHGKPALLREECGLEPPQVARIVREGLEGGRK